MKKLVSSILLAVALVMAGTKAIQAQTKDSLRINVEAIRALDEVDCYVAFVPKRSGTFTIKVVNQSRVASGYLIAAQ